MRDVGDNTGIKIKVEKYKGADIKAIPECSIVLFRYLLSKLTCIVFVYNSNSNDFSFVISYSIVSLKKYHSMLSDAKQKNTFFF